MDSKDIRNLQEAYLDVYDNIMEKEDSEYEKASDAALDSRYGYGRATGDKRSFGRAANRSSAAAALRALRRGERSGSGTSREAGADAVHQGWTKTAKTSTDQTPEKKERRAGLANTPYSNLPDDEKEKDRVSFDAVRATYNRNKNINASYDPDLYDTILEYLINEGYADTVENAESIMVNMSEDWRESIVEDAAYNTLKGFGYPGALVSVGLNKLSGGKIAKPDQPTVKSTPTPKAPTVSSSGGAGGKVTVDKQYPATLNKEKGMKSTGETGTEYFTPNIRGTNITDFDKAQYKNTYTNTYKDIPARQSTKNPQSHLSRTGVPRVYARTASYGIDD